MPRELPPASEAARHAVGLARAPTRGALSDGLGGFGAAGERASAHDRGRVGAVQEREDDGDTALPRGAAEAESRLHGGLRDHRAGHRRSLQGPDAGAPSACAPRACDPRECTQSSPRKGGARCAHLPRFRVRPRRLPARAADRWRACLSEGQRTSRSRTRASPSCTASSTTRCRRRSASATWTSFLAASAPSPRSRSFSLSTSSDRPPS